MSGAREVLLSGPSEVDIVIARGTDPTTPRLSRPRMPESSVDYENVLISPQDRGNAKRSVFLSQLLVDEVATKDLQPSGVGENSPSSEKTVRKRHYQKNGNSINNKLLRKAIASYSGNKEKEPRSQSLASENVTECCEMETTANFCTLPRRPRSTMCTFHTVIYEKGEACSFNRKTKIIKICINISII